MLKIIISTDQTVHRLYSLAPIREAFASSDPIPEVTSLSNCSGLSDEFSVVSNVFAVTDAISRSSRGIPFHMKKLITDITIIFPSTSLLTGLVVVSIIPIERVSWILVFWRFRGTTTLTNGGSDVSFPLGLLQLRHPH